jgi:hypothetical protein
MAETMEVDEVGEDNSDSDIMPDLVDDSDLEVSTVMPEIIEVDEVGEDDSHVDVLPDLIYLPSGYIPNPNRRYEQFYGISKTHNWRYFLRELY